MRRLGFKAPRRFTRFYFFFPLFPFGAGLFTFSLFTKKHQQTSRPAKCASKRDVIALTYTVILTQW